MAMKQPMKSKKMMYGEYGRSSMRMINGKPAGGRKSGPTPASSMDKGFYKKSIMAAKNSNSV